MRLQEWPALAFNEPRSLAEERDADQVRAGLHRDADLQTSIGSLLDRIFLVLTTCLLTPRLNSWWLNRQRAHPLTIQRKDDLVWLGKTADVARQNVSRELDADAVLGIHRKVIVNDCSTACAERQTLEMIVLSKV